MALPTLDTRPEKSVNGIISRWNAIALPLQYKIDNTKWPTNTDDAADTVNSVSDDNGYAKFVLAAATGTYEVGLFVTVVTTNYNGIFKIRTVAGVNITLDVAFGATDTGTLQMYYNNYTSLIKVYAGISVAHSQQDTDPMELIGTIEQRPDTDNSTLIDVKKYVKTKLSTVYNESQSAWPNDLNQWTDFRIEWAERFDGITSGEVVNDTSAYTPDIEGSLLTGTTDGATAFWLIDTGASFLSTVIAGQLVHNTTDDTWAKVRIVQSDTSLILNLNIFASGEDYEIADFNICHAVNSAQQFGYEFGGNMGEYVFGIDTIYGYDDSAKWLTFFQRPKIFDLSHFDLQIISNANEAFYIRTVQTESDGSTTTTETEISDKDYGVYHITDGVMGLPLLDDTVSVSFTVLLAGVVVSETITMDVDNACAGIEAPLAPSDLTATLDAINKDTEIDLAWVDNSDNETGFEIWRSLTSGSGFALIDSVGIGVTSYSDTGRDEGTTYYYKVRSTGDIPSAFSNEATATTLIAFTFQVKTDNAGASANDEYQLPTYSSGTYDCTVIWGDNNESDTITAYDDAETLHSYTSGAGTYTIKIFSQFDNIVCDDDPLKLLNISKWGDLKLGIGISDVAGGNKHFLDCSNLTITAGTDLDMSGTTKLGSSFEGCAGLTSFPLIDLSGISNIQTTWKGCTSLTSFPLLDTSSVTSLNGTWQGCTGLTSFPLIDTSAVTGLANSVWSGCTGLTSFPLLDSIGWTTIVSTWQNCSALTGFPEMVFSSATNATSAWNGCTLMTSFSPLNFSAVTGSVNLINTWLNCSSLTSFPLIDLSSCTGARISWKGCSSLTSFPKIDTSGFTFLDQSWFGCTGLTSFPVLDTSSCGNISQSWSGCTSLATLWEQLDSGTTTSASANKLVQTGQDFDTSIPNTAGTPDQYTVVHNTATNKWAKVTNVDSDTTLSIDADIMGASDAFLIHEIMDFGSVTTANNAFLSNTSLTDFPLFDLSSNLNFSNFILGSTALTYMPNIDFSSGTNFASAFQNCTGLTSWEPTDFTSGTNMLDTWNGCTSLTGDVLPVIQLHAMTNGARCFLGFDMGTISYDAIIIDIEGNNVETGVAFGGGSAQYTKAVSAAATAHANLLARAPAWVITDGGPTP